MKKILILLATSLVVLITLSCNSGGRHVPVEAAWADEGPMLSVWQTNISQRRLWADKIGMIENDSVKIRELVKELRIKAKANDTLIVSCLMFSDAAQDTVVQMYGIK